MRKETERYKVELIRASLESNRASYLPLWKEISEYMSPTKAIFTLSDVNNADRRNHKIIDPTPVLARRTLQAGMMAGLTSPARPWLKLSASDPNLMEIDAVKTWFHVLTDRMLFIFAKSNLYKILPSFYGDLGTFGTAVMLIEEDFDTVIRLYHIPIGTYCLGLDGKNDVSVFYREFRLTVRQLIDKFGRKPDGSIDWSIFSTTVRSYYDSNNLEQWIDVGHLIQPNDNYNPNDRTSKPFQSLYFEKAYSNDDKFLRKSGYDYFPVLVGRWDVTGEDVYGTDCPGIIALGAAKSLQVRHKRKDQAIEKMVNPPLMGPSLLKTQKVSLLPGDITYVDEREGMKGLRPIHEITNLGLADLNESIAALQHEIKRAFYEDLFLMLAYSDRREMTAREVDERHEEKLYALGPVVEKLNDVLDRIVSITFNFMLAQGIVPAPPPELQGTIPKIEYISIMSQAQKMIGISTIERFVQFAAGGIAALNPEAIDKIDTDQIIDEYGERLGVPPRIIVSDESAAVVRQMRAKAQQALQQHAMMVDSAKALKQVGSIKNEGNFVADMIKQSEAGAIA